MNLPDDDVTQRIRYLIEHGGIYPESRPRWLPWLVGLVVLQLIGLALHFK